MEMPFEHEERDESDVLTIGGTPTVTRKSPAARRWAWNRVSLVPSGELTMATL